MIVEITQNKINYWPLNRNGDTTIHIQINGRTRKIWLIELG
jgi:hypothetical protein